jgi:anaphase-promoting complex subunit 4
MVCRNSISKPATDIFTGQLLAVAWNDGSVRLVGAESTKIVHQFTTGDATGITCMGWVSNLTRKVTELSGAQKRPGTWGDFLSDDPGAAEPLNLPRDLSQIDIETSLPKLSVLAASSGSS